MKSEPKPKLKRDWVGRYVRLLRAVTNHGGVIFSAGEIMRVTRYRGGLNLITIGYKCATCERHFRHGLGKIPENYVSLLPESYRPKVRK